MTTIYKLLRAGEWAAFRSTGKFAGSPDDLRDGYIHMSTAEQLAGTRAKYFGDQPDAVVLALDGDALGDALRWEPSRGGALFPHLYRSLDVSEVRPEPPSQP